MLFFCCTGLLSLLWSKGVYFCLEFILSFGWVNVIKYCAIPMKKKTKNLNKLMKNKTELNLGQTYVPLYNWDSMFKSYISAYMDKYKIQWFVFVAC